MNGGLCTVAVIRLGPDLASSDQLSTVAPLIRPIIRCPCILSISQTQHLEGLSLSQDGAQ